MKVSNSLLLAAAALVSTATAQSINPTLKVGDGAPPIQFDSWLKGQPVERLEKGKVYVVEFWATWCVPCKQSIPHLTELQKKYADAVTCIGVDSFEQDWHAGKPFVANMGGQMAYAVAVDRPIAGSKDRFMAKNWVEAAGSPGIPTAFVIDRMGKIAWIGHPMQMDDPLSKIVAGTWDAKAYEAGLEAQQAKDRRAKADFEAWQRTPSGAKWKKFGDLAKAKNYRGVLKELAGADELPPDKYVSDPVARSCAFAAQAYQNIGDMDGYYKTLERWFEAVDSEPSTGNDTWKVIYMNNGMAWPIVDPKSKLPKRDFDFALKVAKRLVELTKGEDANMLDTLAWAYYGKGNKREAIETETRAEKLASEAAKKGHYTESPDYKKAIAIFSGSNGSGP